jgi:Transglycosylase SLT domain
VSAPPQLSPPTPTKVAPGGETLTRSGHLTRRVLLIGAGVVVAGLTVIIMATAGAIRVISQLGQGSETMRPSTTAMAEIPPAMLQLYQAAPARWCPGLSWTVLAGVGWVETRHGTASNQISLAGAKGPMQFMPGTWARYGVDADGNGIADIWNPADAIAGAAHYLCANGAGNPATLRQAIWNYNHDWDYVDRVLAKAAEYGAAATTGPVIIGGITGNPVALIRSPRVTMTPREATDLMNPRMDPRVIALLQALAQTHTFNIVVVHTGHSMCVGGGNSLPCSVSNHYFYRAVDLAPVDGAPVSPRNAGALTIVKWLGSLQGPLRPTEVGSPWNLGYPGHFTDRFHQNHIHIGYDIPLVGRR